MKKEKSCGIIVFNNEKVLVIHQNIGHWGLPKGHVEIGETEEETAIREVFEETGINANIIPGFRKMITYQVKENIIKDVVYFVGTTTEINTLAQECEVSEVKWMSYEDALEVMSHDDNRNVLKEAISFYNKNM